MIPKLIVSTLLLLSTNFVLNIVADEFFKVPLDIRSKNRPERIVETSDDPDLRTLKEIQDKFFIIVGNSSMGKEFKSFNQLLHLVDSNAGIELGRLLFKGVMIGYGKENSNQLFTEFLDDFQYRLNPDLADALIDYKDFMKTIDLKLIPLTIATLFRKDELGNSLAQMPLGQLIDLVQPEASKYGIDIKGVINGILGKGGDSTFPDMVKKLLDNFNIASLLNGIPSSGASNNGQELKDSKDVTNEIKMQRKDPTLMLFKPLISNFLKENKIDLDTEAVIQVMTPFITPLLQSFMPSGSGKDGKQNGKLDFAQMLPMLTLLGSQLGGSNNGGNILASLTSLMAGLGGNGKDKNPIVNLLNTASEFLENATKKKKFNDKYNSKQLDESQSGSSKKIKPGAKDKNDDSMTDLLKMASSLIQTSNKTKKPSKDGSAQAPDMLESVMSMMSMMGKLGGKDGKKDDSMANLLNVASSLLGSKKNSKNGSDQKPDIMESVMSMVSLMGGVGKNGKKDDSMGNLLNIASSLLGNKKQSKDGSAQPDIMESLGSMMSLMGGLDKNGKKGDSMANILQLASSVLGSKIGSKEGDSGQKPDVMDSLASMLSLVSSLNNNGENDDSKPNILNLAASILGKPGKDGKPVAADVLGSLMSALEGSRGEDMISLITMVTGMMKAGKNGESVKDALKSHPRYKKAKENVSKVIEMASKSEDSELTEDDKTKPLSFPSALETFIVESKSNTIFLYKIKDAFSICKALVKLNFKTLEDFEQFVYGYVKKYNGQINIHELIDPLLLPEDQLDQYISQITLENIAASPVITETGAELVKALTDKKLYSKIESVWGPKLRETLGGFGLTGITFDNFPERVGPIVSILASQWNVPTNIETLLVPLQYSTKETSNWYFKKVKEIDSMTKNELNDIYAESFYDNFIAPLKSIWQLRKATKSSPACLARAVCDLVKETPEDQMVKIFITRLGSVIYGGYIADEEQDYKLFLNVLQASVTRGNCKKPFPVECPKGAEPKGEIEDQNKDRKHSEL